MGFSTARVSGIHWGIRTYPPQIRENCCNQLNTTLKIILLLAQLFLVLEKKSIKMLLPQKLTSHQQGIKVGGRRSNCH